jgi:hypothetical protein
VETRERIAGRGDEGDEATDAFYRGHDAAARLAVPGALHAVRDASIGEAAQAREGALSVARSRARREEDVGLRWRGHPAPDMEAGVRRLVVSGLLGRNLHSVLRIVH